MDLQPPPGWTRDGDALTRTVRFADFAQAFAFLTRVAAHAAGVGIGKDAFALVVSPGSL